MSTIEKYKSEKLHLSFAEEWAGLLGKPYGFEGLGGVGCVSSLKLENSRNGATIWYQNYHDIPDSFRPYVENAIKEHFCAILATALKNLREDVTGLAAEALKEHEQLLADAGLSDAEIKADGGKP